MSGARPNYITRIRESEGVTLVEVLVRDHEGEQLLGGPVHATTVALFSFVTEFSVEVVLRALLRTMTAKPARRVRYPALRAVRSAGAQ